MHTLIRPSSRTLIVLFPAVLLCSFGYGQTHSVRNQLESPVSEPVLHAAALTQANASVASNGESFLVVWEDYRRGGVGDIWAARVTAEGQLLDPTGFAVSKHSESEGFPAVVWAGTHWIVAWHTASDVGTVAARVSHEGVVLDTEPRRISGIRGALSMASNGSVVMISDRLVVRTMTSDLKVISGIPAAYGNAIGTDGKEFLVAWTIRDDCFNCRSGRIFLTRISSRGINLGFFPIVSVEEIGSVALASDGQDYLLTWMDGPKVRFAVLNSDGTVKRLVEEPSGIEDTDYLLSRGADLFWAGSHYVLLWNDQTSAVRAVRISASGSVLGAPVTIGPGAGDSSTGFPIRAAAIGDTFLAAGTSRSDAYGDLRNTDIHGLLGDANLMVNRSMILSQSALWQTSPSITTTRNGLAVSWREHINDEERAVFLSLEGSHGWSSPMRVSAPFLRWGGDDTAVASVENSVLVLWTDSNLNMRRYALAGVPLDIEPISLGDGYDPAASVLGENYLVVWVAGPVVAARIPAHGVPPDVTPLRLSPPTKSYYSHSSVAAGTRMAFVVWSEGDLPPCQTLCPGYAGRTGIFGTRISEGGTPLDPGSLILFARGIGSGAAASDGTDFLVVASQPDGFFARKVFADGTVGPETRISDPIHSQPSVTWDGSSYVVVAAHLEALNVFRIRGYRLTRSSGLAGVTFSFRASTNRDTFEVLEDQDPAPQIVSLPDGNLALTYTRIATEPEFGSVSRAFVRRLRNLVRARPSRR